MAREQRRTIPGHAPRRVPRSFKREGVKLSATVEVTVVVRSKGSNGEWNKLLAASISGLPQQRQYLTRAEYGEAWSSSPKDLAAVSAFGRAYGLKIVSSDAWRRCVVLSGTLSQLQKAFDVEFYGVRHPLGLFRSHRGRPQVTASIYPLVEAVLGLDDLPSAKPRAAGRVPATQPQLNLGELRTAYAFPPRSLGKGQCVAVIELGGGLYKSDYREYFRRVGLAPPPLRIKTISGATNQPAPRTAMKKLAKALSDGSFPPPPGTTITGSAFMDQLAGWTWDTAMDLQIIGTLAPEAALVLVQGLDNDQGQYHAVTSALSDARNAASAISCSWSTQEQETTPKLMPVLDRWFQAAAVLGVTMCYSAGDMGDGTMGERPGNLTFVTSFPATSPYVLACGGTTLDIAAETETAWNQRIEGGLPMAGGGGFSKVFARPSWQIRAGIDSADWIPADASSGTGRGVPDVCAKADLNAAFSVIAGGMELPAGGTSEAAPIWAALIAVLNGALNGAAGCINPLLYQGGLQKSLRDIKRGNIGFLRARAGWDPATGWGSPRGELMLKALKGK